MATSAGEVEVKLTLNAGDFKKLMGQSQDSLKSFSDKSKSLMGELGKVFTFTAIAGFFKESITAFGEQEIASTKLIRALENQGRATAGTVGHLNDMATSLSKLTATQDEVITSAQGTLVSFGLQGEALDKATKAALDMSVAMGIDLGSATTLLGKAFQGNTGMLARYGIEINKTIDPSKRFAAVLSEVNSRFGGSAEAQAQTFIGQIKALGVAFNEFQESVGQIITGESGGILHWLVELADKVNEAMQTIIRARAQFASLGDFLKTFVVSILGTIVLTLTTLIQKMFELLSNIPIVGRAYALMAAMVGITNQNLSDQIAKLNAIKVAAVQETSVFLTLEKTKQKEFHNTYTQWVAITDQQSLYTKDKMAEEIKLRAAHAEELKKAQQEFVQSFVTTEADMWQTATQLGKEFTTGVGDSFAKMLVEGKSFADSMVAVFRSLAEQIISYIVQMIVKMLILLALESATGVGPAGGAAMSGFSGMMASGGVIAEPSIITGLRSGRRILAGEAGPEMVTPMGGGGNRTAAEMGGMPSGGGGGGGITINISGQFIDGDSNSWQRLMREKIIPEIRRFTMSSPTGPFNRTRGVV